MAFSSHLAIVLVGAMLGFADANPMVEPQFGLNRKLGFKPVLHHLSDSLGHEREHEREHEHEQELERHHGDEFLDTEDFHPPRLGTEMSFGFGPIILIKQNENKINEMKQWMEEQIKSLNEKIESHHKEMPESVAGGADNMVPTTMPAVASEDQESQPRSMESDSEPIDQMTTTPATE